MKSGVLSLLIMAVLISGMAGCNEAPGIVTPSKNGQMPPVHRHNESAGGNLSTASRFVTDVNRGTYTMPLS